MNTNKTVIQAHYGANAMINWNRPIDCDIHGLEDTPGCFNCELIKPHNDQFAGVQYCKHRVPVSEHCEGCEEEAYWAEMDRLYSVDEYEPDEDAEPRYLQYVQEKTPERILAAVRQTGYNEN